MPRPRMPGQHEPWPLEGYRPADVAAAVELAPDAAQASPAADAGTIEPVYDQPPAQEATP